VLAGNPPGRRAGRPPSRERVSRLTRRAHNTELRRSRSLPRRAWTASLVICAVCLAGCSKQSILSTHSPPAHNIMLLWPYSESPTSTWLGRPLLLTRRPTAMTIEVIGHQWWWEVHYPATGAVPANEIHIPVDAQVNVVATTADAIHSFWVPALNRKIDMIPGRQNRILLYATRPAGTVGNALSSADCSMTYSAGGLRPNAGGFPGPT
jgi:Cytochrome C oxidase subunit II, periplasmic domain